MASTTRSLKVAAELATLEFRVQAPSKGGKL